MAVDGGGKRVPLNMRTTEEVRALLEAAAGSSGRSLAAEVEHRIAMSFEWERAFGEAKEILSRAKGATEAGIDAAHNQAGHLKVSTSAGKIWAEPGALDAFTAPSIAKIVKGAVAEALAEAGIGSRDSK